MLRQKFYEIERNFHDRLAMQVPTLNTVNINLWEKPLWAYISDIMGDIKGKKILDIGCGFGREAIILTQRGAAVHGIDLSEKSIARASTLAHQLSLDIVFQVGNIDTFECQEGYFDIIFSRATLHHLPLPAETLKRLRQYTKIGGLVIAQEPREENPVAKIGRKLFNPSTSTEHPFKQKELKQIFTAVFGKATMKHTMVLSPLCFIFEAIPPLRNTHLSNLLFIALNRADKILFQGPLLERYAWIEIVHSEVS